MGDFSTDILTKNSIQYLDGVVKNLIKATESLSRTYIVESKRLTAKENLQFSLEKYYKTTTPKETVGEVEIRPELISRTPEYELSQPPSATDYNAAVREKLDKIESKKRAKESTVSPGVPGVPGLPGAIPSTDGSNGRLGKEDLVAVGTLSSSPQGGPYWYGRTAYLRPDAAQAFLRAKEAARKDGVTITINSAYRSLEHQEALIGKHPVVAVKGKSSHGDGVALDIEINAGWHWMVKNGMKYGWKYMAIRNDEVHFQYVGGGSTVEPQKKTSNVPQQVSSSGKAPQVIAVVNNQSQSSQPQQVASASVPTSLNKNYSNFSEVLLTHTTFNVG